MAVLAPLLPVLARVAAPAIGRAVASTALKAGVSEAASSALGTGARMAAPSVGKAVGNKLAGGGAAPAPHTDSSSGGGWLTKMQANSMSRVNQRASELHGLT